MSRTIEDVWLLKNFVGEVFSSVKNRLAKTATTFLTRSRWLANCFLSQECSRLKTESASNRRWLEAGIHCAAKREVLTHELEDRKHSDIGLARASGRAHEHVARALKRGAQDLDRFN